MPRSHVLNVIAEDAQDLARELGELGEALWLAPGRAFDLHADGPQTLERARAIAGSRAADINLVAVKDRRKKLLIADMDSTIIGCEVIDELADMAGIRAEISAITERVMRGEIEFPAALRARVALLKGLPLAALDRVYKERVRVNPGAKTLVATMHAHGARTLLVSGGFTFFTERVAADVGFDSQQGNILLDDGSKLLGKVAEPILGREAKLKALEQAVREGHLRYAETLAVGDGANDLAMIKRAGLGVAYHAKPVVAAAASANIAHGDLSALLYLQGFRADEIVRA